jgi:hypothetical protein
VNHQVIESIKDVFNGDKIMQKIAIHNPEYYVSEAYLKDSKLISVSKHKYLYNIMTNTKCSEIEGLDNFINEQGFTSAEDSISGCFIYPENGFMGWHTNHTRNDWRMYIVNSIQGDSFFRYVENEKIKTEYDPKGWSYRIFYVGDASNPFWHCVHGGSGRRSIGFRLKKLTEK